MTSPSKRIFLTGFMGAGKSVVAESLASHFDCQMVDLDALIAGREGRSIADIIDDVGEVRFREMETSALVDTLQYKNARVVALGGGTWTREQNRAHIEEHDCLTVWLDTPFELCWQRITHDDILRPLARDKEKTQRLYDKRRESYTLAAFRIEITKDSSVDDITAGIIDALRE